jgi:lysozyme
MSKAKTIAAGVAGVLAAGALAVPMIAEFEGFVPVGYPDPALGVKLPTACYGATAGIVIGKRYSEQECANMLAADALRHGLEIAPCLPAELPIETRAAFTSFGFNVGTTKFCASSLSRKARAGDLPGACAELAKWVYGGGKPMAGLIRRRQAERKLCMEGLS